MKSLPKIEKKHLVAGASLTAVALIAFAVGTTKSTPNVAIAKPAHDLEGAAPVTDHSPTRAPASAPADDSSSTPEYEEEEVDTQIAKSDRVKESASAPAPKEDPRGVFARFLGTYFDAWQSVNDKVQSIQQVEEENKKLKLENAYLRVMVETGKYTLRTEEAKQKTETVGKKLVTAAGSRAARSIASIRYQFPENLLPEQLHALGVSYFKSKDDEKAAVILNFLTELEDDKRFRTASNYLMAGVAFFRLDHYKNASEYFERIVKLTETDEVTLKAKRQATYWQALVAERMKNRSLAQKLILESLEKDPLTKEARWVNPQGKAPMKRMPASEESHEGHAPHPNAHHE